MRPYLLTHPHPATTPTKGRAGAGPRPDSTSRHYYRNQEHNTFLILDARIHYPVLKHPTNHPHPPGHRTPTPPAPHPRNEPGTHRRQGTSGMPAGVDPHQKKQPTPTPPTGQDPHPPPAPQPAPDRGTQGGRRGPGLFPQDPTVRHHPHPGHAPGAGIWPDQARLGVGTSTMFPPTSTHPAAPTAARGRS